MIRHRPLQSRIVAKIKKPAEKTKGGIYIPQDTNKPTYLEATILACGHGYNSQAGIVIPLEVKVGDKVLMINNPFILPERDDYTKQYDLQEGEQVIIFQENDIYTVLEEVTE